jgi:hypothetical protein
LPMLLVSGTGFIAQMSRSPSRSLTKAICDPSGDQAAPLSCDVLSVSGGSGSSGTAPPFELYLNVTISESA